MVLAAVTQLTSSPNILSNLSVATSLIRRSAAAGARMVFLPEATDFIAPGSSVASLTHSRENAQFVDDVRRCAKEARVWVSVGVHEPGGGGGEGGEALRCYNTQLVIDDEGSVQGRYRKTHLFDVDIKGGLRIKESDTTKRGDRLEEPVRTPVGSVGLLTCYDVRFPEPSLILRRRGAQILTYPSAFTVRTGLAHWTPLLQARAIETQSYVVAAAQSGQHPDTQRVSYGRASIVDPWGVVVAQCSDASATKASFAVADIDLDVLHSIRTEMPLWDQRRFDLYPEL